MRGRRRIVVVAVSLLSVAGLARAQQVVFDPSNTFENTLTALVKDEIVKWGKAIADSGATVD